jgi:hypothetical protein
MIGGPEAWKFPFTDLNCRCSEDLSCVYLFKLEDVNGEMVPVETISGMGGGGG